MARDDIYTATLMYTVLRCVGRVWNATDRLKSPTADGARFRLSHRSSASINANDLSTNTVCHPPSTAH